MKSADWKNRTAAFEVEQQMDNDTLIQMMKDLGTKAGGKEAPKGVLEELMRNGSIRNKLNVTVNLDSGLTIHAKQVRTLAISTTVKIDQVELTLQK